MLDFRIATFLQLCETKSYTKTAKLLGMTQPSVTQHIKYLQKKYQCRLFIYEGKTLRLTPEGEYLRRQAEQMTKMSRRISAELQRIGELESSIRFGFPTELGEAQGAAAVSGYLAKHPDAQIIMQTGKMRDLVAMTEDGVLDFTLTDKMLALPSLTTVNAGKVSFGCYVSANLPEEETARFKQVLQQTLLTREETAADRAVTDQIFQRRKLSNSEFASVCETNSEELLHRMTEAGQGVCFAYDTAMKGFSVRKLPLGELNEERSIVYLCRKDAAESEYCKQFFEEFRQAWLGD
ncbi:MAG: LysR family transcriptional regulator [Oscillospiraceae bacterium]|nr:LysR family transcriptional regulator [Oscillospiraceae bacterium]